MCFDVIGIVAAGLVLGLDVPQVRVPLVSLDVVVLTLVLLEAILGHELLLLEGTRQDLPVYRH
jgi:hypothetical protein